MKYGSRLELWIFSWLLIFCFITVSGRLEYVVTMKEETMGFRAAQRACLYAGGALPTILTRVVEEDLKERININEIQKGSTEKSHFYLAAHRRYETLNYCNDCDWTWVADFFHLPFYNKQVYPGTVKASLEACLEGFYCNWDDNEPNNGSNFGENILAFGIRSEKWNDVVGKTVTVDTPDLRTQICQFKVKDWLPRGDNKPNDVQCYEYAKVFCEKAKSTCVWCSTPGYCSNKDSACKPCPKLIRGECLASWKHCLWAAKKDTQSFRCFDICLTYGSQDCTTNYQKCNWCSAMNLCTPLTTLCYSKCSTYSVDACVSFDIVGRCSWCNELGMCLDMKEEPLCSVSCPMLTIDICRKTSKCEYCHNLGYCRPPEADCMLACNKLWVKDFCLYSIQCEWCSTTDSCQEKSTAPSCALDCYGILIENDCFNAQKCAWCPAVERCEPKPVAGGECTRDCNSISPLEMCNRANKCTWCPFIEVCMTKSDATTECKDNCPDIHNIRLCERAPTCGWCLGVGMCILENSRATDCVGLCSEIKISLGCLNTLLCEWNEEKSTCNLKLQENSSTGSENCFSILEKERCGKLNCQWCPLNYCQELQKDCATQCSVLIESVCNISEKASSCKWCEGQCVSFTDASTLCKLDCGTLSKSSCTGQDVCSWSADLNRCIEKIVTIVSDDKIRILPILLGVSGIILLGIAAIGGCIFYRRRKLSSNAIDIVKVDDSQSALQDMGQEESQEKPISEVISNESVEKGRENHHNTGHTQKSQIVFSAISTPVGNEVVDSVVDSSLPEHHNSVNTNLLLASNRLSRLKKHLSRKNSRNIDLDMI